MSRPVPVIPSWITGQRVYGHIVNNENRDNFRRLYPNIHEEQSSEPESLVSIASLIHRQRGISATTAQVYDQGQWHVCLLYVDCRLPGRIIDERGTSNFMDAIENALGITGKPKWYPCYSY